MGQMFPAGPTAAASGFYVPTMPRPYYPNNMQQIRPQPRWPSQQQVRGPAQPGGGMHITVICVCMSVCLSLTRKQKDHEDQNWQVGCPCHV